MDFMGNDRDTVKKMWWLHDSYWHATMVRELGKERANQLNLEANERFFRKYTLMLLRAKVIQRPKNIRELMEIFRTLWAHSFPDEMYIHEPITYEGNRSIWRGNRCHAYDSLSNGGMVDGYSCGCQALRNGAMKALRLEPVHSIEKSLINGDGECIVTVDFVPKK